MLEKAPRRSRGYPPPLAQHVGGQPTLPGQPADPLNELDFDPLLSNFREVGLGEVRRIHLPRTQASRDRSGPYRGLLSSLVSNLSRISSKAPVPMRAPPENGCSRAPTVNKTSPITAERVATINLCAHVLSNPNR